MRLDIGARFWKRSSLARRDGAMSAPLPPRLPLSRSLVAMRSTAFAFAALVLALLFAVPEFALAADPPKRSRRIVVKEGVTVKGQVMRPQLQIMLQRRRNQYDALEQTQEFGRQIVESVDDPSFRK